MKPSGVPRVHGLRSHAESRAFTRAGEVKFSPVGAGTRLARAAAAFYLYATSGARAHAIRERYGMRAITGLNGGGR